MGASEKGGLSDRDWLELRDDCIDCAIPSAGRLSLALSLLPQHQLAKLVKKRVGLSGIISVLFSPLPVGGFRMKRRRRGLAREKERDRA